MKYLKRYIYLIYNRLLLSKMTLNIEEQGLRGRVEFNFPFSSFPEYIKAFIPREYKGEKDYICIRIPFEKKSDDCHFSTAYIQERKKEKYDELNKAIEQNKFSFSDLESWIFYDFLDFLFDHTGMMRNDNDQISRFRNTEETIFWDVLIKFRPYFWFLRFFLRNFPGLKNFLDSIPDTRYISQMKRKVSHFNLGGFESRPTLWLMLKNERFLIFIRKCNESEFRKIFKEKLDEPDWFNQINDFFSTKGYEFMRGNTKFANEIHFKNLNLPELVCFLFKKSEYNR